MSQYIPFGAIFLSVLVATLFNRTEVRALREDMNKRFDQVDQRFQQVDQRFEQVNARFQQVDQRFQQVDARFDRLEARLDRITADMTTFAHEQGRHDGRIDSLERNRN